MTSLSGARDSAQYKRALAEFHSLHNALELYYIDNNKYPVGVSRGTLPPGLDPYIAGSGWPEGPWESSVYDWDNWDDPDNPGQRIYQISMRFCPLGGPLSACNFPDEDWADGFLVNSSLYYCVEGACRSHANNPIDYPGHCVNCD